MYVVHIRLISGRYVYIYIYIYTLFDKKDYPRCDRKITCYAEAYASTRNCCPSLFGNNILLTRRLTPAYFLMISVRILISLVNSYAEAIQQAESGHHYEK